MKKLLLLLPLLVVAGINDPRKVTFTWDYADFSSNIVFNLYSSKTANAPFPWQPMASISGTNSITISVVPSQAFYYVTASNVFWGLESDPSNIASTPSGLPSNAITLTIKRSP